MTTDSSTTEVETEVVRFGDLREGDQIIDPTDGRTKTLRKAYDEHIPETMYEVTTSDGSVVEVSGNHLWYVIPQIDKELHAHRVRAGKKLGRTLSTDTTDELVKITEHPSEEAPLSAFAELLKAEQSDDMMNAVVRVAESIGHIAEENFYIEDLGNPKEEATLQHMVRMYDSQVFAQQLLSLFQYRDSAKRFPLLVGRVINTEEMLEYDDITIPDAQFNNN